MSEQIIFYVTDLMPDESIGMTRNPEIIAYNNSVIGKILVHKFTDAIAKDNEATHIVHIGRYICSASVSLNSNHFGMFFMDFKGDRNAAIKIANHFEEQETRESYMIQFDALQFTDQLDYNNVKLIKGKPPKE